MTVLQRRENLIKKLEEKKRAQEGIVAAQRISLVFFKGFKV